MSQDRQVVFETERVVIRLGTEADVELYYQLWTNPRVMANVGFPQGIPIAREELRSRLAAGGKSEFEHLLVVELKASGEAIGECALHPPDEAGIASTDVKLLPAFWGHKYGVEIKRGLLAYLFDHTDCVAVEATPNVGNAASIKMQEAVGAVRVGEGLFEFPESMRAYATPVPHYFYRVSREDWVRRQEGR